jgi:hypothetical protein
MRRKAKDFGLLKRQTTRTRRRRYDMAKGGAMDRSELVEEIRRINKVLADAARRAAAQNVLIDKLTAAHLRVQTLLKKLRTQRK